MTNRDLVRLNIKDPGGIIKIEEVVSLPPLFKPQTAYLYDGDYYINGEISSLRVSDELLDIWLSESGATVNSVTVKSIEFIQAAFAEELIVKKHDSGAENMEYQSLKDLIFFYNNLIKKYKEDITANSTVVSYQTWPDTEFEGY